MNYWWVRFVAMCFHDEAFVSERLLRNSICYKAAAEISNLKHALQTGDLILHREDAFEREHSDLFQRLKQQQESRFLTRDDALVADVLQFMMTTINEVWSEFSRRPFLTVHADVLQRLTASGSGVTANETQVLLEHYRTCFRNACGEIDLEVEVVQSVWWHFNEFVVVVTLPPGFEIESEFIAVLIEVTRCQSRQLPQCFLYLRIGNVSFPLTPELPKDFYRGVMTAATIPDVTLKLGERDVCWTDWSALLVSGPESERFWSTSSQQKREQLERIQEQVAKGEVGYTSRSVDPHASCCEILS
ncbi:MAG: hypothetical protein ACO3FE_08205 [Planctomycetaceae bacterium]